MEQNSFYHKRYEKKYFKSHYVMLGTNKLLNLICVHTINIYPSLFVFSPASCNNRFPLTSLAHFFNPSFDLIKKIYMNCISVAFLRTMLAMKIPFFTIVIPKNLLTFFLTEAFPKETKILNCRFALKSLHCLDI
ncbi:hypothetical protein BpHYR1_031118 [Brachionus plicatilis]|uniref:Uncharacterized protein n=1 Tax=Brachionus plicatilis TaxID=10195 RepID=A0A3M7RSD0_BRAPC|nr:hypothetical protein BpHYR1_031118 [Brachionus plicatilis]